MKRIVKNFKLSEALKRTYINGRQPHNLGMKTSEEARLKMSKSHTGKILTEEHKKNIGLGQKRIVKKNSEKIKLENYLNNHGLVLKLILLYLFTQKTKEILSKEFNIPRVYITYIFKEYKIPNIYKACDNHCHPMSDEGKLKLSKLKKGVPNTYAMRSVVDNNTGKTYQSISEMCKEINISNSHVSNVLKGKIKNSKLNISYI